MTTTKYIVHGINCLNGKYSQQTYRKLQSAKNVARCWKEEYKKVALTHPDWIQPEDDDFYIEKQVIISERIEF